MTNNNNGKIVNASYDPIENGKEIKLASEGGPNTPTPVNVAPAPLPPTPAPAPAPVPPPPPKVTGSSITVSTTAALIAALKEANNPTIINMTPGKYSVLSVYGIVPKNPVTIQPTLNSSGVPTGQVVIEGMGLQLTSGFTFSNIIFTCSPTRPLYFVASAGTTNNLTFENCVFSGPVQPSAAAAPSTGLVITKCNNVNITNCIFQYVNNGLGQSQNNGIVISRNLFANIFGDACDNAASTNVTLTQNCYTNPHIDASDAQHSDFIQFWTTGETTGGSNILVAGNIVLAGNATGAYSQGTFISDPINLSPTAYSNVTVENNVYFTNTYNAITFQHVNGVVCTNNYMQCTNESATQARITCDGSVVGSITNNWYNGFVNEGTGNSLTLSGNTVISTIPASTQLSAINSALSTVIGAAASGTIAPDTTLFNKVLLLAETPITF